MTIFRLSSSVRPRPSSVRFRAPPVPRPSPMPVPAPTPVPWRVLARGDDGVVEVEHVGSGPLRAVRFALAGAGMLGLSLPRTVYPGERLRALLRGSAEAVDTAGSADAMLVLRWFQPDGHELLWPIAL